MRGRFSTMKGKTILYMLYGAVAAITVLLLLTACMVTPPVITDVYRDGDDLVFHKAGIHVNTITYQMTELDGRDVRVRVK